MKVSIIMPFYKGTFFLEDALQSLKEQTVLDFEVILIFDHIEEDISTIIENYQTELHLKVYYLQNKRGVAAARNYGISQATGDYIYFLDSDDYIDFHTIETLLYTTDIEKIDIIYGKKINTWFKRNTYLSNLVENEVEEEKEEETEITIDTESDLDMEENTDIVDLFRNNRDRAYKRLISVKKYMQHISVLNILIKRSLITENHIKFNEDIKFLSDLPFLFQILHYADTFEYQPKALYIKRKHNDSVNYPSLSQMDGSKDYSEYIKAYQSITEFLEKDSVLRSLIDKKFLRFYSSFFAPCLFRNSKNIMLSIIGGKYHE
jgi:CDP-glycerol glycerophosphotransferase